MSVEHTSISAAIFDASRTKVVGILRANDPEDRLAGLWGLPAVSLRGVENDHDAILRIGKQKLGTILTPIMLLGEKTAMVSEVLELTLRLWEASFENPPDFNQRDLTDKTVSQYVTWAWKSPDELIPAARKKSLCTQLLLENRGIIYDATS